MGLPFKKRVLIVEDDQEIRNSFTLIVNSSQKFTVVNAYGNSEDAIALASTVTSPKSCPDGYRAAWNQWHPGDEDHQR